MCVCVSEIGEAVIEEFGSFGCPDVDLCLYGGMECEWRGFGGGFGVGWQVASES